MPKYRPITLLGVEGGATHTVALWTSDAGQPLKRIELGPGNVRLLTDRALAHLFQSIAQAGPTPSALAICLAGLRNEEDHGRVTRALPASWRHRPKVITHDLDSAWAAARKGSRAAAPPQILVLAGTGSCCFGRNQRGEMIRVGGWGHQLGDRGSAYDLALQGLRASIRTWDRRQTWTPLGVQLLRHLDLHRPDDLLPWIQTRSKDEIAALAPAVFAAAQQRDSLARDIVAAAAQTLAEDALACARRLARRHQPITFVAVGSVLAKQPAFFQQVARRIRRAWPAAKVSLMTTDSVEGAVALAAALLGQKSPHPAPAHAVIPGQSSPTSIPPVRPTPPPDIPIPTSRQISPTELRHPGSLRLHELSAAQAVKLMLTEEAKTAPALIPVAPLLAQAVVRIDRAFSQGGRLFYVGAGTSGRLGVLDASECPPTFRTALDLVQGIIAGGPAALVRSIEGAEDDVGAGADAVHFRGVSARDVVVGLAASGRTPFVWGALTAAKRRHATTILVCFNPYLEFRRGQRPDIVIAPNLGPEILTGSTRLKAGTATKLILNIFTTLAMVRQGKVVSNLMIDLNPSNTKLRERAIRILTDLTNMDATAAQQRLEANGWRVKETWQHTMRLRPRPRQGRSSA